MMLKLKNSFFLLVVIFLFSCKNETNKTRVKKGSIQNKDFENIETLFDEKSFNSSVEIDLLNELNLCDLKQKDLTDHIKVACNPKFFKLFPFIKNKSVKDAFLIQVKARVGGFPLRRLIVYERENNVLIKVNEFYANLIKIHYSGNEKHADLVLRFTDNIKDDLVFYNCLFVWIDNHYHFQEVLAIDDFPVKKKYKDSMDIVIESIINKNRMVF